MAINQPSQSVFSRDLYPSLYDKASILVINLAKKHPFYNDKKWTALLAMITFLEINGYTTTFSQEEAVKFILAITISKKDFDTLTKDTAIYLKKRITFRKNNQWETINILIESSNTNDYFLSFFIDGFN